MRSIPVLLTLVALAACAAAQTVVAPIIPSPVPVPVTPALSDLQKYLNLTDPQVTSLESIMQQQQQAQSQIYQQISQKQQALETLLESVNPDPRSVGQLTIDIQALQKQAANQSAEPYHTQALAVLNPAQTNLLAALSNAFALQTPAWQAVTVNLITAPKTTIGIITPYPIAPVPVVNE